MINFLVIILKIFYCFFICIIIKKNSLLATTLESSSSETISPTFGFQPPEDFNSLLAECHPLQLTQINSLESREDTDSFFETPSGSVLTKQMKDDLKFLIYSIMSIKSLSAYMENETNREVFKENIKAKIAAFSFFDKIQFLSYISTIFNATILDESPTESTNILFETLKEIEISKIFFYLGNVNYYCGISTITPRGNLKKQNIHFIPNTLSTNKNSILGGNRILLKFSDYISVLKIAVEIDPSSFSRDIDSALKIIQRHPFIGPSNFSAILKTITHYNKTKIKEEKEKLKKKGGILCGHIDMLLKCYQETKYAYLLIQTVLDFSQKYDLERLHSFFFMESDEEPLSDEQISPISPQYLKLKDSLNPSSHPFNPFLTKELMDFFSENSILNDNQVKYIYIFSKINIPNKLMLKNILLNEESNLITDFANTAIEALEKNPELDLNALLENMTTSNLSDLIDAIKSPAYTSSEPSSPRPSPVSSPPLEKKIEQRRSRNRFIQSSPSLTEAMSESPSSEPSFLASSSSSSQEEKHVHRKIQNPLAQPSPSLLETMSEAQLIKKVKFFFKNDNLLDIEINQLKYKIKFFSESTMIKKSRVFKILKEIKENLHQMLHDAKKDFLDKYKIPKKETSCFCSSSSQQEKINEYKKFISEFAEERRDLLFNSFLKERFIEELIDLAE